MYRITAQDLADKVCCDVSYLVKVLPQLGEIENGTLYFTVDNSVIRSTIAMHVAWLEFYLLAEKRLDLKKKLRMMTMN